MAWNRFTARSHVQNFSDTNASNIQPHWGYVDRIVPCTNDAGSCEYLDVVYHSHDLSMLCTGIFWASIVAMLLVWGVARHLFPSRAAHKGLPSPAKMKAQGVMGVGGIGKLTRTLSSLQRRFLLCDLSPSLLGHITRLQVTILLILSVYLFILSFIGITYKTWITPVSSSPGLYNTRTTLGPLADRIGVLAYALTPLSVLLASRESLLSLVTGVPYQSFMFLHRWTGYIILVQSGLHTLGWVIVEAKLYQPQPSTWYSLAGELYIQWGFVALSVLIVLWVLATPWGIKLTGYEFFRKAHYCLAMVYIGAIIGHWEHLKCFLIPGMLLWFLDRLARAIRMGMLHYQWLPVKGKWGFEAAKAGVIYWEDEKSGDVIRLDFEHTQQPWQVGQHFYLCFPEGSIWQSHPMTPLSLPVLDSMGKVKHSYVIRAKGGETKKIANAVAKKLFASGNTPSLDEKNVTRTKKLTTPVILTGPYGIDIMANLTAETNVLCIAGGTGITFVMPVLLQLVREQSVPTRKIGLVWVVRRNVDMNWVQTELDEIKQARCSHGVNVDVYMTREKGDRFASSSSSSDAEGFDCRDAGHHHSSNIEVPEKRRPRLDGIVRSFVGSGTQGSSTIYASGPGCMISDLRNAVAASNEAGKVWGGDASGDVRLICDNRLE